MLVNAPAAGKSPGFAEKPDDEIAFEWNAKPVRVANEKMLALNVGSRPRDRQASMKAGDPA